MKRTLNPDLVIENRSSVSDEHWVFLRDPKYTAFGPEQGIGRIEIEEIPESKADSAAFRQKVKQTMEALNALAGLPAEREPHVILTKDCLDFEGPVYLLIYSDKPFASPPCA